MGSRQGAESGQWQQFQRFGRFVERALPDLRRLSRHLCRRRGLDSEDLLQDILERALRHLAELPPEEDRWLAWLNTAMRHLCVDRVRHQQLEQRVLEETPAPSPAEEEPWRDPRAEELLVDAVRHLPEGLQQAYRLHLAGLSYARIARRLGISEGTVGSRLTLARRRLWERLAPALRELKT